MGEVGLQIVAMLMLPIVFCFLRAGYGEPRKPLLVRCTQLSKHKTTQLLTYSLASENHLISTLLSRLVVGDPVDAKDYIS